MENGNPWILTKEQIKRFNFDDGQQFKNALDIILSLDRNLAILSKLNSINKGWFSRSVTIGTTPTLIQSSPRAKAIILQNPSLSAGLTSSGTLLASALRVPGTYTTRATALGVANYERIALFLDITVSVATSTLVIDAETRDQLSLSWMGTQGDIFASTRAVQTDGAMGYYANLGTLGNDVEFAIEAVVGVADITFSVGYTLKSGLPGTGTGVASTIFLGPSDGVNSTAGYPLLSGAKLPLLVTENTELWGVALGAGQTINVFELT